MTISIQPTNEPAWIPHNGSRVCPVPEGHDVEIMWGDKTTERRIEQASPHVWGDWPENPRLCITHYRDWTVFYAQEKKDDHTGVAKWAQELARKRLYEADPRDPKSRQTGVAHWIINTLARHIMLHEEEPESVDPLRQMITKTLLPHFDQEDVGAVVDDLIAGLAELQQDCRQVAEA